MSVRFDGYKYNDHILHADGVSLDDIASKLGTPTFVYNSNNITEAYHRLDESLKDIPHLICYAVKANSNLSIIKTLGHCGAGADIVSKGELYRSLEAGIPSNKIVFSGVGKTREEIDYALQNKILSFNVESEQELLNIDWVAKSHKKVASVILRINPDVNPKTHPYISTGLRKSKFGIPHKKALEMVKAALKLKNVNLIGIGCHIGSQITQTAPFVDAAKKMLKLLDEIEKLKAGLTHLDLGGGLGIVYHNERPPSMESWTKGFISELKDRNLTLILEPGRCLVGNAGILLTKVTYVKRGESDNFIIVDSGMNDLLRPSLYEAYHSILPVKYKKYRKIKASVVGPCCETGDIIAKSRRIQNFQQGDLLAIMSCGAYAASMSSHYNSRMLAAEVLVKDSKFYTIRERESLTDLVDKEQIPAFLNGKSAA